VLSLDLFTAALLYLPGMITFDNQTLDSFYRWWVVHLWVEGVWELIMGSILCYLLIKLTGVDREVVEKWLYVIVGFTFLSGILGTGHHYYYIGAPKYWLMDRRHLLRAGAARVPRHGLYALAMAKKGGRREHPNKAALNWTLGCAIMSFVGAGFLGFAHTLPQVNLYTHGTLVTAMHGHMAFWGAYAMINLAMIAYTCPCSLAASSGTRRLRLRLLDVEHRYDRHDRRARRRRHHAGESGAPHGHGLPRRAQKRSRYTSSA
jgi:nitric oxide reductase subunit B